MSTETKPEVIIPPCEPREPLPGVAPEIRHLSGGYVRADAHPGVGEPDWRAEALRLHAEVERTKRHAIGLLEQVEWWRDALTYEDGWVRIHRNAINDCVISVIENRLGLPRGTGENRAALEIRPEPDERRLAEVRREVLAYFATAMRGIDARDQIEEDLATIFDRVAAPEAAKALAGIKYGVECRFRDEGERDRHAIAGVVAFGVLGLPDTSAPLDVREAVVAKDAEIAGLHAKVGRSKQLAIGMIKLVESWRNTLTYEADGCARIHWDAINDFIIGQIANRFGLPQNLADARETAGNAPPSDAEAPGDAEVAPEAEKPAQGEGDGHYTTAAEAEKWRAEHMDALERNWSRLVDIARGQRDEARADIAAIQSRCAEAVESMAAKGLLAAGAPYSREVEERVKARALEVLVSMTTDDLSATPAEKGGAR